MGHPQIMIIIYIYISYIIYILCLDLVFFAVVVMRWDEISAIASLDQHQTCGLLWSAVEHVPGFWSRTEKSPQHPMDALMDTLMDAFQIFVVICCDIPMFDIC